MGEYFEDYDSSRTRRSGYLAFFEIASNIHFRWILSFDDLVDEIHDG